MKTATNHATSIESNDTRIIPASKERKCVEVCKLANGSMGVEFGNGDKGGISDPDMQAFIIWTMLNSQLT